MPDAKTESLSRRDAMRIAGLASALSAGLGVVLEGNEAMGATVVKSPAGTTGVQLKLVSAEAVKLTMNVFKIEGGNYTKVTSMPVGSVAHKGAGTYSYKFQSGGQTVLEQSVVVTD